MFYNGTMTLRAILRTLGGEKEFDTIPPCPESGWATIWIIASVPGLRVSYGFRGDFSGVEFTGSETKEAYVNWAGYVRECLQMLEG